MHADETRTLLTRRWSDANDQAIVHEIYHEDVVLEFPQGGERLAGLANVRAMREAYPASVGIAIRRDERNGRVTSRFTGERADRENGRNLPFQSPFPSFTISSRWSRLPHRSHAGGPWPPGGAKGAQAPVALPTTHPRKVDRGRDSRHTGGYAILTACFPVAPCSASVDPPVPESDHGRQQPSRSA